MTMVGGGIRGERGEVSEWYWDRRKQTLGALKSKLKGETAVYYWTLGGGEHG